MMATEDAAAFGESDGATSAPGPVPGYEQLLRPVLDVLSDGEAWDTQRRVEAVADLVGLDTPSRLLGH